MLWRGLNFLTDCLEARGFPFKWGNERWRLNLCDNTLYDASHTNETFLPPLLLTRAAALLMTTPSTTRWPDLGTFWTIPNALSLSRIVLVIPITALLWFDGALDWLFGLVMLAILTDWFDGRMARWLDTESEWGKVLDPIADKIGAVATISALTFRSADPTLPLWFFVALISRDLAILAGSMLIVRRSGKVAASVWAGKAATFWLAITVLAAMLKADPPVVQFCVWMTTMLLALSFVVYLIRYLNAARRTPPQPATAEEQRNESWTNVRAADEHAVEAFARPPSGALTEARDAAGDGTPGQSPESPSGDRTPSSDASARNKSARSDTDLNNTDLNNTDLNNTDRDDAARGDMTRSDTARDGAAHDRASDSGDGPVPPSNS